VDKGDIYPVYQGLWTQGTNSTSSSLVAYGSGASAAYYGLYSQGTNSTSTALASSTYQYIGGGAPLVLVTFASSEYAVSADSLSVIVDLVKSFSEYSPAADIFFDFTKDLVEYATTGDELFIALTKYFDEYAVSGDSLSRGGQLVSNSVAADSLFIAHTKTFSEYALASDEPVEAFPYFDVTDSMAIMVEPAFDVNDSAAIDVSIYTDESYTMDISIVPSALAAVVNASSLSNPFLPTIIAGGVTYVTNACTAPPPGYVVGPNTYWVNYLNTAIGGTSLCDMTQSNLELNTTGGSFSIASQTPLGGGTTYSQNLGQVITAYGLTGTITDFGKTISNNANTYQTEGIFGSPNLNKAFNLITYGGNQYFAFLNNQYGLNYAPPINSYTTVRGMAQAIAATCGIGLSWLVPDAPYHDIFGQSGLTGLDALNTLAGQLGANVRWNGGLNYSVAYPDFYQGSWTVPNPLLLAGPLKYSYHQDLGYGVSGSGVLGVPTNVYFDPSVKTLPVDQATTTTENLEIIATVTKPFTQEDPTLIVDLDNDIISVKIQILVKPGTVTGGARYVTDNSSIWFDLGSPAISNPYVKVVKVGSSYRNQLWADYTLFPSLNVINNGNFTMNFAVIRRSLAPNFQEAQQNSELLLREIQARIAANVRFIKTYTGTITCYFFGSLPLPGMWASATYCGETVQGIVESVSLTGNGILTVQVAQYYRINLLDAKLNWALTTGNYTNI